MQTVTVTIQAGEHTYTIELQMTVDAQGRMIAWDEETSRSDVIQQIEVATERAAREAAAR